jgi:hypothetical protein
MAAWSFLIVASKAEGWSNPRDWSILMHGVAPQMCGRVASPPDLPDHAHDAVIERGEVANSGGAQKKNPADAGIIEFAAW